jgi:hypothetical protein
MSSTKRELIRSLPPFPKELTREAGHKWLESLSTEQQIVGLFALCEELSVRRQAQCREAKRPACN